MSNKKKLKEIKQKLNKLEELSIKYKEGNISDKDFSDYLMSEIDFLKKIKVNELKKDIRDGLLEIKILMSLNKKIELGEFLTIEEEEFLLFFLQ